MGAVSLTAPGSLWMSPDLIFGLLSALANAVGGILSRDLAVRLPARQLIGPLFALNALVVAPFAFFIEWHVTPHIVLLHTISVLLLIATALAVWDLFAHGAASATITAQSISPLPAAIAVAILLPGALDPVHVVAAVIVVLGVLGALSRAFGALSRRRTLVTVLVAAIGTGLVTVMGRLLADEGAGVFEIYVVRTAIAAVIFVALVPPRDIPLRQLPRLTVRAVFISLHFLLILVGVREGSPAVVQTAVATAPLFVIAFESVRLRSAPSGRAVVAAVIAMAGVAIILAEGW